MLLPLALSIGVAVQPPAPAASSPSASPSPQRPVRVWLPDTLPKLGDDASVYVRLGSAGHLMVLHADAAGRIRVLFPETPAASDIVPGGRTFEIGGAGSSGTLPVAAPGAGLVLAVRSDHPFDLAGLAVSGTWDYEHALLFQPTAGNLFAALLDIADRVSAGRPYQYDQAAYRTPGSAATRVASGNDVCIECYAVHASAPSEPPTGTATATLVDCSGATLVDSFCGVQDNRSYVTESYVTEQVPTPPEEVSGYPVVVPVYYPVFIPSGRHVDRRHRRGTGLERGSRLRALPDHVGPPPPRRRPTIVVRQPYAPSRPRARGATSGPGAGDLTGHAPPQRPPPRVRHPHEFSPPPPATPVTRTSGSIWATAPVPAFALPLRRERRAPTTSVRSTTFTLPASSRALVPSRAFVRALQGRRR